jgi:hypothetical protein
MRRRLPKTGNNRIQSSGFLNQYSPFGLDLEKMFFTPALKIVLQHNRANSGHCAAIVNRLVLTRRDTLLRDFGAVQHG